MSRLQRELGRVHKQLANGDLSEVTEQDTISALQRFGRVLGRATRMTFGKEQRTGEKNYAGRFRLGSLSEDARKALEMYSERLQDQTPQE